jgi:lysophospholipase L1-like esterase
MDAQAQPVEIVCIGDSITQRGQPAWEYPTYVQQKLGPAYRVTNCGHNGALLTSNPARTSDYYLATSEFKKCKVDSPAPDIATIMLGTNDSGYWDVAKATYEAEYGKLVAELEKLNPRIKIVAASSPSAAANWGGGLIKGAVIRDQIAPLVRAMARQDGYVLADVNAATSSWFAKPDLTVFDMTKFADAGVHPNDVGAKYIADQFVAAIQQAVSSDVSDAGSVEAATWVDAGRDAPQDDDPDGGGSSPPVDAGSTKAELDAAGGPSVGFSSGDGSTSVAPRSTPADGASDGTGCSCRMVHGSTRAGPLSLLGLLLARQLCRKRRSKL